jgi:hypothetical protein
MHELKSSEKRGALLAVEFVAFWMPLFIHEVYRFSLEILVESRMRDEMTVIRNILEVNQY